MMRVSVSVRGSYLRPDVADDGETELLAVEVLVEFVEQPWFLQMLQEGGGLLTRGEGLWWGEGGGDQRPFLLTMVFSVLSK